MQLRSPYARVRGWGSAKDGVGHWWAQRLTAVALVPLALWFVASVIHLVGAPYAAFTQWVGHPINATLLLLLMVWCTFTVYASIRRATIGAAPSKTTKYD